MTYWRLYYHLIWSTRDRLPLIDPTRSESIRCTIIAACREEGVLIHAIGIVPDHLHLALSIPPRIAIVDLVRRLKSASSKVINRDAIGPPGTPFAWQGEYGVLSFGERSLPDLIAYVQNQATHHAANDLRPHFELTDNPSAK